MIFLTYSYDKADRFVNRNMFDFHFKVHVVLDAPNPYWK